MKIAVLDWETVSSGGDISEDALRALGNAEIFPLTKPEETAERIGNAEIVLCNKVLITSNIIKRCPNLKYIGLFATGFNNIDIEAASERGITVCNAGQYSTDAVAQQVFAYILDHYSRIRDYDSLVRAGEWEQSSTFSYFPLPIGELSGKTLSIVGYGSIGRRVAEIGCAFGMNIVISTRTAPNNCPYEVADIHIAARKADILTFHCPLTERTENMINKSLLCEMKKTAVLINTARGGIADESALTEALKSGIISAAYVDVLKQEPMSSDTPLKNASNCIITPHTAWAALETRRRLVDIVCENVRAWQRGTPINKVN